MAKTKLKSKRGASKRFKFTATGKARFRRSNRAHILTKKAQKRKRHLRGLGVSSRSDLDAIRNMIQD